MSPRERVSTSEQVAIIGLTGGIATGKSTVTEMFRALGATVIDADVIAREVVQPGSDGLAEIVRAFGEAMLTEDGALDRAKLGEVVFADAAARQTLNAITHPRIAMRMMELAELAHAAGDAWVIYDAALLIENKIHELLPATIVVSCPPEVQLERLMARDQFTEAQARERIASQLPIADKVAAAQHVIDNSGTREATQRQVETLFATLVQTFGRLRSDPQ